MVLEIWNTTDKIFCHFGLFFALLLPKNPENQNFEKMKKKKQKQKRLDILFILDMCTINENHMMYGS